MPCSRTIFALSTLVCITLAITSCIPSKESSIMLPTISTATDAIALFPTSVTQIEQWTDRAMAQAKQQLDQLVALKTTERTFANTARALDQIGQAFMIKTGGIEVAQYLHPDKVMRDAAQKALIRLQNFAVDQFSNNVQLYQAFKNYAEGNAHNESLNEEEQYFITETMDDFRRAGLDLPQEQRDKIATLKKELAKLSLQFDININNDKSSIIVSRADLTGLDEDFIKALKRTDDGQYILTCDYPTYFTVMKHCAVEQTRKALYKAFNNRAYPDNIQLLDQIIALRHELAQLLGYPSFAHLDIDKQMAATPERVQAFLDNLIEKAQKKAETEFKQWSTDLPPSVTLTDDNKFKPWDMAFVTEHYKQKHFDLDDRIVSEYFPMEKTIEQLLDIYQQFFELAFKQVPASGLWDKDVQVIEVRDAHHAEGAKAGQLRGYLFLDLYPRPDKYSHAAHAGVMSITRKKNGSFATPDISVVMANFPKSSATKPSLLKHSDVTTFFHEFGHAIHALLGATEMASFSGTAVRRDFVEAPSQMLEKWMFELDMLRKVSGHYQTGKPLSEHVIKTLRDMKKFDAGNFIVRQAVLSQLALDLFNATPTKDTTTYIHELYQRMLKHVALDPEYHMQASFGHLTGYGSKYYGYLWSNVFASDMFNEIKQHGLLNPAIGRKYKETVLGKGGSAKPDNLLRDFLGREPNQEAFLQEMGLQ